MKIKSTDAAHVDVALTISLNSNGTVSATGQKVLVDDTTGQSAPVGDPFPITLSDTDQNNVNSALEAALTDAITAAVVALPAASDGPTAETTNTTASATEAE